MDKKRVLNLYRVSTKMQVKENDIPMQKSECTNYIRLHPDWVLCGERSEKGISGFKNASRDRDVLNEIMQMARRKEFDVLLVYMSDRLGRREDDTPFFVADLNRLGIEVWSVNEGQLKTKEHIDKLLNYIRFWNAEGESLKTSVRVRDAQLEMLKRGEYTGGGCPYGYSQVYSGKYNNKGRALKKLVIHPEEAEVVRKIFELSTYQGMGGYRIAQELNLTGIPTKKNSRWTMCTVNNILRNPLYKGYYTYGKDRTRGKRGHTPPEEWLYSGIQHPELIIIEEAFFDKAQKVREARTPAGCRRNNTDTSGCPSHTHGRLLLMGLVYCGYCGGRLSNGSAYDKWTTKDGVRHEKIRGRYKCIAKSEGGVLCTGRTSYSQELLETAVLDVVSHYIRQFSSVNISNKLMKEQQRLIQKAEKELHLLQSRTETAKKDVATLKERLPQAIRQEFVLSLKELQELLTAKEQLLEELRAAFLSKRQEYEALLAKQEELRQLCPILPVQDTFADLGFAEKKLFLSSLIKSIHVKKDELRICMRIRLQDMERPDLPHILPPIPDSDESTSH